MTFNGSNNSGTIFKVDKIKWRLYLGGARGYPVKYRR